VVGIFFPFFRSSTHGLIKFEISYRTLYELGSKRDVPHHSPVLPERATGGFQIPYKTPIFQHSPTGIE